MMYFLEESGVYILIEETSISDLWHGLCWSVALDCSGSRLLLLGYVLHKLNEL